MMVQMGASGHFPPAATPPALRHHPDPSVQPAGPPQDRKRKAEPPECNERLSKRLSLLHLEQNAPRSFGSAAAAPTAALPKTAPPTARAGDDVMQLDDSKHKVYIYDLDADLASEAGSDDGGLIFLPGVEEHLRRSRIPPHVLASSTSDAEARVSSHPDEMQMQMVLYSDPKSLSLPRERDSVHKVISESRQRVRERQKREQVETLETILPYHLPSDKVMERMVAQGDDTDAMDMD